jgi:uncharacterized protein (DUF305 family)
MKSISTSLIVSSLIVSFVIGLSVGYYISPTYQQSMFIKGSMDLGKADRFVDLRYINQMAAHHRGAMLLAEQISLKTKREEIKKLAVDIQAGEPKLIEELYGWKRDWYNDNRQAKDPIVPKLGEADEKVDLRFLNALIAHHEAGIEMTQDIRTKSSRSEVLNNADAVENFLSNSLITLKAWRKEWFNVQ